MENRREHEQLVHDAEQSLQRARLIAEALFADLADAEKALAALATHRSSPAVVRSPSGPVRIATAEGRRLPDGEFQSLNEDDYDVILDQTEHTLRYREDPESRTPLVPSEMKGLGSERLRILAYMLEHPARRICSDTLPQLLGEPNEIMEPDALSQTICLLRQTLGVSGRRNVYILTESAWNESRRRRACVYRLNPEWNYLIIKWAPEINRESS